MSDENTPKLRLRPKLAGGPPPITPAPAKPPMVETKVEPVTPVPPVPVAEVKPAGLRPRPSIKSEDPVAPSANDPQSFPPPTPKPALVSRPKPILKAAEAASPSHSTDAAPPFPVTPGAVKLPAVLNAPPPPIAKAPPSPVESWPAVLDAPPPSGLAPTIVPGAVEGEPAEIAAIRKASTFPFPAPTAKFPPLPGLGNGVDTSAPESSNQEGSLRKFLLFGTLGLLLLASGGYVYLKFFSKSGSPPVPAPQPAAVTVVPPPNATAEKIKRMVEKAEQEQFAPLNEVVAANETPAPVKPVTTPANENPVSQQAATPDPAVTPAPVVQNTPPPPPSMAFKAWVINLRIRGVRGGDAQRVTIEKTTYVPGDMVNPQLGITFVGYDESTRMLTFQDKTGATFERRH